MEVVVRPESLEIRVVAWACQEEIPFPEVEAFRKAEACQTAEAQEAFLEVADGYPVL